MLFLYICYEKKKSEMSKKYVIHWFRRDLRLEDNTALRCAAESGFPVKCIFIFDKQILDDLPQNDRRVSLIYDQLVRLKKELQGQGSDLAVYYGEVGEVWRKLKEDSFLQAVYANTNYEPYATKRDNQVAKFLAGKGLNLHLKKDQVIFEKHEILTQSGSPYSIYTPYSKAWKMKLGAEELRCHNVQPNFLLFTFGEMPSLQEIGFEKVQYADFPKNLPPALDENYATSRDFPALDSTSHLSIALRFGLVSIRQLVRFAKDVNTTFLNELIWREFFMQILWHYPKNIAAPFKQKYKMIAWRNDEKEFAKWCAGKTGYPLVDAGMRELNAIGYMHNRVRMITASFLVKHLLIDWRWGEAYFAEKLLDYELASNNGNWQWVAGCGTDAAPYFRIFNPTAQQKRFDKEAIYIRKWLPEYGTDAYPEPIVEHKFARERCLRTYKKALAFFE